MFICDGYDSTTNTFHIVWGWGDSANGWFRGHLLDDYNNYKYILDFNFITNKSDDVNMDGNKDITDVIIVGEYAEKTKNDLTNSVIYNPRYDINNDGTVNMLDSNLLLDRYVFHRDSNILTVTYKVINGSEPT